MPDISMCEGIDCKQRMKCYRYTAYPNTHRQAYLSQPLLYAQDSHDCKHHIYNSGKPNRFIKNKKRKLPWEH